MKQIEFIVTLEQTDVIKQSGTAQIADGDGDAGHIGGVETTGIHRYRHTFAKQWILNGGNVVTLSRLLGHSSLEITQNYINLLVSDVAEQVNEINLLDKFAGKHSIKMKRN